MILIKVWNDEYGVNCELYGPRPVATQTKKQWGATKQKLASATLNFVKTALKTQL